LDSATFCTPSSTRATCSAGRLLGLRLGLLLDFRHERRAPRLFLGDLRLEARDRLIERLGRPPLVVGVVTGILM
jgi:hypothetical protein